jgi:4-diphosphocytidyl-2-C-methyl-D-erythritol kinase
MFEPFGETARAKINLALHVLGRRADGYHDLDSIVAFADVGDELTFSPAPAFSLTASGPFAAALPDPTENIIARAYETVAGIVRSRGHCMPPVAVDLTKNLPVASGIGGGSANAAAAMRGFLKIAGISRLDAEIVTEALKLGADVPVCLTGKACRMQGIGERITPLAFFKSLHAVLVNPLIAVPTPAVFRQLGLEPGQAFAQPIADADDPACWRNDLAPPAMALAPVIGEVLRFLENVPGVARAFMSGSGATCVGLSAGPLTVPVKPGWWMARATLS